MDQVLIDSHKTSIKKMKTLRLVLIIVGAVVAIACAVLFFIFFADYFKSVVNENLVVVISLFFTEYMYVWFLGFCSLCGIATIILSATLCTAKMHRSEKALLAENIPLD